jgi:hypothetical protein
MSEFAAAVLATIAVMLIERLIERTVRAVLVRNAHATPR